MTPKYRGHATDRKTHTIPFPGHLPQVPEHERKDIDLQHSWHIRLNHVAPGTIRAMAHQYPHVLGLPRELRRPTITHCSGCARGHMQRAPHSSRVQIPPVGHTLVTDIIRQLPASTAGYQYVLTVTGLATRFRLPFLLKSKSQAESTILEAVSNVTQHFGKQIARLHCDNANEYLTKRTIRTLATKGIRLTSTTPHTPQENAVSERLNRTIMDRVRATLATKQLPFGKYWPYCVLDTVVKTNSTMYLPTATIPRAEWDRHRSGFSPYPTRSLSLRQFRTFGEYGHVPDLRPIRHKQENRGTLVRYLYTLDQGHIKVLNPSNGHIFTARIPNFQPYNPHYDPARLVPPTLPQKEHVKPRVNAHHAIARTPCVVWADNKTSGSCGAPLEHTRPPC